MWSKGHIYRFLVMCICSFLVKNNLAKSKSKYFQGPGQCGCVLTTAHISASSVLRGARLGRAEVERVLACTRLGCLVGVFFSLQFIRPPLTMSQALGQGAGCPPAPPRPHSPAGQGGREGKDFLQFPVPTPGRGQLQTRRATPLSSWAGLTARTPRQRWSRRSSMLFLLALWLCRKWAQRSKILLLKV